MMQPLDRPIWPALSTLQRAHSIGTDRARRYLPDIGPLSATADDGPDSLADLGAVLSATGGLGMLQVGAVPLPPGAQVKHSAPAVQMVAETTGRLVEPGDLLPLGAADAAEMLALAELTKPGPFGPRTYELGSFYGIRIDGRLAAMAGERMRFVGHTEASGVCTHPDFRGRGFAARLLSRVVRDIVARGDRAFLHAYATNATAIRLYEQLGFSIRAEMTAVWLIPA